VPLLSDSGALVVSSSTQDDIPKPVWQQPAVPMSSAGDVAPLLTYPPYIAPVPPPHLGVSHPARGIPAPSSMGGPQPVGVPPPGGVSIPVALGVTQSAFAESTPASGGISRPLGGHPPGPVCPPAVISMPTGLQPPAGSVPPAPAGIPASLPIRGPQAGPVPPPAGISMPIGVAPPAGVPAPAGGMPPSLSISGPQLVGGQVSVGIAPPAGVPGDIPASGGMSLNVVGLQPVGGQMPIGIPPAAPVRPQMSISSPASLGVAMSGDGPPQVGVFPPTVNPRLPPRFMANFDPTVPPPALTSAAVSSVAETSLPVSLASRAGEDMDLDNSASSEEDVGEGFDEEWPICSRRVSKSQHPGFVRDQGSQLSELQASDRSFPSSETHFLQDKQPVKSDDYFRRGIEQPHMSRTYGTSLPLSGGNFASSSAHSDHMNPLPSTIASMAAVGGQLSVRSLTSLSVPASMPAGIVRAPGSMDPGGNVLSGLSDVDFRTSYGGGMVPPMSAPVNTGMIRPPLPPLPRPLTSQNLPGPVRPFSERSLPLPNSALARMSGDDEFVEMEKPGEVLGPSLVGAAYPSMPGKPPPGVGNIAGPMPLGSAPGMVPDAVRGASVGQRFISQVPGNTCEPACLRPPSQQVFMQGSMNANPGMMPAPDIGPLRGQITGGVQMIGSGPVGSCSPDFVAGGALAAGMGNSGPLRGRTDFTGVMRNMAPPHSGGFSIQPEVPRIRTPSLPLGANNINEHSILGPPPQVPFPRPQLPGQFPGVSTEQKSSSSGPSEKVLNALQSLAGMQTDLPHSQPPSFGSRTGAMYTRFPDSNVEPVDEDIRQMAPGQNRMLLGPQLSGFGSMPIRSLLPQQDRTDVIESLHGSLPALPRIGTRQPHYAITGKIHSFIFILNILISFVVVIALFNFHYVEE